MAPSKKAAGSTSASSTTGSLDAYWSPKKASGATNTTKNKVDTPDAASLGSESTSSGPNVLSQLTKRKRADDEGPTNKLKGRQSKGYASPKTYSHLPPLTDTLTPNLLCVFVGLNPGIQTATKGHPYAHPTNKYWYLLYTSGLTPDRRLAPSEYIKLPSEYSLGNTNIVSRATRDGSQLSKEEMVEGAGVLDEKIKRWKPEVVCLVGKSIWEAVWKWKHGRGLRKEEFRYGFQDGRENMGRGGAKAGSGFFGVMGKKEKDGDGGDGGGNNGGKWEGARVFVGTSTSGLAAGLSLKEKEDIWAVLGEWVKKRREERESLLKEKAVEDQ